ncbi:hypothetical protein A3F05_00915 [Candidatus Saccharibacteria bacterium RIFCSPHIGHO2_12_FULL_47_17]|nr:MAG: hypothetical protein A3F05_00915 [Candidatus Saccharibacteria bacterium RIFCSPHIGHO2_12_FULL_47_17]
MKKICEYANVFLLCLSAIVLLALQETTLGYGILIVGLINLGFCGKEFRRNILLVYSAIALLGVTPFGTSIGLQHVTQMGFPLLLSVATPYLIAKYVYRNNLVSFPFNIHRIWRKKRIAYILFTLFLSYLILPFILRGTNSYLNWIIEPGFWNILTSYIGLNAVAAWEELFFITVVLAILRRHLPFWQANIGQAIMFASFLFGVGWIGWSFVVIFAFALSQGYIYQRTGSLAYVLAIHLSIDIFVHLSILELNHPGWVPIFIT